MPRFLLKERLRYGFDNTLTKGTQALIGWLALASLVFVAIMAALVVMTGNTPMEDNQALSFPEVMWHNLMRTLDAGTMGSDTGSASYLLLMLVVSIERGERDVGVDALNRLSGALGVSLAEFFQPFRRKRR